MPDCKLLFLLPQASTQTLWCFPEKIPCSSLPLIEANQNTVPHSDASSWGERRLDARSTEGKGPLEFELPVSFIMRTGLKSCWSLRTSIRVSTTSSLLLEGCDELKARNADLCQGMTFETMVHL